MAYEFDFATGDIVISGFEKGIGDSPYDGLTDLKNINIISLPKEASINFATQSVTSTLVSGNLTSASGNVLTVSNFTNLENGNAIVFAGGSLPSGIVAGTVYWITALGTPLGNNFEITSDFAGANVVTLSSGGTGTYTTFAMNAPTFFAYAGISTVNSVDSYWLVDAIGQVWSNKRVTATNKWVYTGNKTDPFSQGANAFGNGLGYYQSSDGHGYIFVFRNGGIDYTPVATLGWIYGWNPQDASSGNSSNYLHAPAGGGYGNVSHYTLVGQDNVFYFCDTNFLGSWFEKTGQIFSPSSKSTYTNAQSALQIPTIDNCNCLAELGINLLVGGQRNAIYPWDRTSTSFTYPILLAESDIQQMVTVNTNTYIFTGNRGRIYITNGGQAQLWQKLPDHVSGTVEPYFVWGGACSTKNQLYFSAQAFTNPDSPITAYGGVWGIDLDTGAMRLTNQLSYGTYMGSATAITQVFQPLGQSPVTPPGTGLYIGWNSGASTYGLDATISTPYTGGKAVIVSDMIPVGTFYHKNTPYQVEWKTAYPLTTGESVQLLTGNSFADYANNTFANCGTTLGDTSGTIVSGNFGSLQNGIQWLLVKAVLTFTSGTPTYNRITELRVTAATAKTNNASQPISLA